MYRIVYKRTLNPSVKLFKVEAPLIAKRALPGEFVVLRAFENGERIPLTISDCDEKEGTITLVFQEVGLSTTLLGGLETNDYILDVVGPLGIATHLDDLEKVVVVGGGLGCAIAYPQVKYLHNAGATVDCIAGFRNKELVILEDELRLVAGRLFMCTDDGSYGEKGFVTDKLKQLLDSGEKYDCVIAIGPLIMMKFVCKVTEPYNLKTIVSLNPIMTDGTGMCGCCRVTVGGKTRFACVDGPDFDGHQVDFDELIRRNTRYKRDEEESMQAHRCRLSEVPLNG